MDNIQIKSARTMLDLCWALTLTFAVCVCAALLPDMASASPAGGTASSATTTNAISQVFCNVVVLLTGITGKAIATVAIIAVGVGALLGKISWGMALIVTLGIGLIFGAATIVNALGGDSEICSGGTLPSAGAGLTGSNR